MKDNFKKQLWLSAGIILGTIVIASVGLYFLAGSLSDEADKIIVDRVQIQTQTNALANLAALKRDAPQAAKYVKAIRTLIPGQYGLVGFGQWLNTIGVKHSVTTSFALQGSVTPASAGAAGGAGFSMDAEGTRSDVISFLRDLESQAQGFLLSIDAFDITRNGDRARLVAHGTLFFK